MWKSLKGIEEVQILELDDFVDDRGTLSECWRQDELRYEPVMAYLSWTKPGQVRGPHEHVEQADLFVFAGPGAFALHLFTYIKHPTTGEIAPHTQVILPVGVMAGLKGCKPLAVLVPPGIVHGYRCVSDEPGLVINMPDRLYRGPQKKGEVDEIRHEDDPDSPFKIE